MSDESASLVAIVGMAGRFPRAADLDAFWDLLITGGDAIGDVPADRWNPAEVVDATHMIPAVGGFLDGIDQFDAAFFGISPREATVLDPQQRLMLETTWRALENAGQQACHIRGSRTGVYVGGLWHDYELLRKDRGEPATQHSIVGNSLDIVASRVSYFLGVTGPSLVIESSCSSSLVALHQACQALRHGEIDAALVGGANLMLTPEVTVGLTHFGGLSPTGRCRPFGSGADGFVRGEGVAVVYLKTLERARHDGDGIRAVIVASAVNNDGGGDSLVTPNTTAQEELLRQVYGSGAVPPEKVAYVEAHGTGTGRGDAAEASALGQVLGSAPERGGRKLHIGSVKSNIGHLEPAAGLAGLAKAVLSLEHGVVPASLHADELNPDIDFERLGLDVVRQPFPLDRDSGVYIGVNSFGWGGTNAHAVLTGPPRQPDMGPSADQLPVDGPYLLPLSGHSRAALLQHARDVQAQLASGAPARELAQALAWHRDHFAERLALVVGSESDPAAAVQNALDHPEVRDSRALVWGRARTQGKVAFVFPGQGAQWRGMGAGLYGHNTAFTQAMDRCADALFGQVDWDVRQLITGALGDSCLSRVDMVQPALWAMSVSLAAAWEEAGVRPDVVVGHSQGEIAAATVAGVLSYADAALVVSQRSSIVRQVADRGRMLAVDLDTAGAQRAIEGFEESVGLAVHNGPRSCVLSGEIEAVLLLKEILESNDVFCRLVDVDYASHSPQIDPLVPQIRAALKSVRPKQGHTRLVSTVDLNLLEGTEMGAEYWADNLRQQVRFAEAVDKLVGDGVTHLVEVSPHTGLAAALRQLGDQHADPPAVLGTLRRGEGSPADLVRSFADAYVCGLGPWGPRPLRRPSVTPPPYPWQRERYWVEERRTIPPRGGRLELPLAPAPTGGVWQGMGELDLDAHPWLADHRVQDACVFPAGAYLALVQHSLGSRAGGLPLRLWDVALPAALTLGAEQVRLSGTWRPASDSTGIMTIASMTEASATETRGASSPWTQNCRAQVSWGDDEIAFPPFPERLLTEQTMETDDFYRRCARRHLDYGPAFRSVSRAYATDEEALVSISHPGGSPSGESPEALHPVLWDGILQGALAVSKDVGTLVPTSIRAAVMIAADGRDVRDLWVHARRTTEHDYDLTVFDRHRRPVGRVDGLILSVLPSGDERGWAAANVYRMRFEPNERPDHGETAVAAGIVCGPPAAAAHVGAVAEVLTDSRAVVLGRDTLTDLAATAGSWSALTFVAPSADAGLAAQREGLTDLVQLVRHCLEENPSATLSVVTHHAQPAPDGSPVDPGAALYSGITTVLQAEYPQFHARLVDIDTVTPVLGTELAGTNAEDLVVLRGDRRWVGRRSRGGTAEMPRPWQVSRQWQPFRTGADHPGRLDSLCRWPVDRLGPRPGEVEVEVGAASLNFIDVMKAMGVYPDTSPDQDLLGLDCAGTVTAFGEKVTDLSIGDQVVACGFGALASHVTVDARHVVPIPDGVTPAQAAALPIAMATAWHALVHVARVQPGETVLVHSATGGLGLAAIQVARMAGANVLGTAGTEEKRRYLRRLGLEHVFDSRHLSWAEGALAATAGRGVDVVINSLAGAAIPLGLDVLADDGRFIELGKRDIHSDASVDLRAFKKAVTFAAVDIAGLLRRQPERFASVLRTVWACVDAGQLTPLPVTERSFADVEGAFRTMSRGEHIGKIVLTNPRHCTTVTPQPLPDGRFRSNATYLITGGMGALGLSLAEFLAASGAGGVALLGRSAPSDAAAARIDALRRGGTHVGVWCADVADEQRMTTVLEEIRASMPMLRGVFHAAGVLEDATLPNLDPARIERVLSAKADGAVVLDRVTADDALDLFVLFSSAATFVGTAGQGAYAAANAYLDALAVERRRSGRAGLSVQWGPVAGVGLAAQDAGRGDRLADRGMRSVPVEECWRALTHFIESAEAVVAYVALDARRWVETYPAAAAMASWRPLVESAADSSTPGAFGARLRDTPAPQRRSLVEDAVRRDASSVLRIDPDTLERDRDVPLKALGLDSLMSLELRNKLEASLGIRLSPTLLWKYGSLSRLGVALSDLLDGARPAPDSSAAGTPRG